MEKKTGDIMKTVYIVLIILISSLVLGTGVVLYGVEVFHVNINDASTNIPIVKQIVTYHTQGVEPTIEIGNYTEKSSILAVDSSSYDMLLVNGEKIDFSTHEFFCHPNGFCTTYYEGNDINDIVGSKAIVIYSILKPTCAYVFDWGDNFHSQYKVEGFNFTQIPNSTNYDFVQQTQYGNSCNDTIKNIEKVEVYVK